MHLPQDHAQDHAQDHPPGHPGESSGEPAPGTPLVIDCDTCSERRTAACDDCVVGVILGRRPGEAVVLDIGEHRSLRILADAGLVPPLRHRTEPR